MEYRVNRQGPVLLTSSPGSRPHQGVVVDPEIAEHGVHHDADGTARHPDPAGQVPPCIEAGGHRIRRAWKSPSRESPSDVPIYVRNGATGLTRARLPRSQKPGVVSLAYFLTPEFPSPGATAVAVTSSTTAAGAAPAARTRGGSGAATAATARRGTTVAAASPGTRGRSGVAAAATAGRGTTVAAASPGTRG